MNKRTDLCVLDKNRSFYTRACKTNLSYIGPKAQHKQQLPKRPKSENSFNKTHLTSSSNDGRS